MPTLKQHVNDLKMIIDNGGISIKNERKIIKLLMKKEKMKEDNVWDAFLESNNVMEVKVYEDLGLINCNDDLIKILVSPKMRVLLNNFGMCNTNDKKMEWVKKIQNILKQQNLFDVYIESEHIIVERIKKFIEEKHIDVSKIINMNDISLN